jgi:hypothetical protein
MRVIVGKISELIEDFHQTGKFSELMERLDVLICIRNEYMKDDWRIVGICGYTEYVGNSIMRPTGFVLKSIHILGDIHIFIIKDYYGEVSIRIPTVVVNADEPVGVFHEYIRRERARDLASMRERMMENVSSLRTAIDVIELEIGGA